MAALTVTEAAISQKQIIEGLMTPYLRELSAFAPEDLSESPDYPYLETYWSKSGRKPYLLHRGDEIAGFALINRWSPSGHGTDWSVAEFYVRPRHRRQGIGRAAFQVIVRRNPGTWEVPVLAANKPAFDFWTAALHALRGVTIESIDGDGERWVGPILRLSEISAS